MTKLNLGCGSNKINGYINIDVEPNCNPDKLVNFITEMLPFEDNSVDEVCLFHTIEHISKKYHVFLLTEIFRVLKTKSFFFCSYPEWSKCAKNYMENKNGQRDFWEATLYGRQLYPSDFHVALMDTVRFKSVLIDLGFISITDQPEHGQDFNTVIRCLKGVAFKSVQEGYKDHIFDVKVR